MLQNYNITIIICNKSKQEYSLECPKKSVIDL